MHIRNIAWALTVTLLLVTAAAAQSSVETADRIEKQYKLSSGARVSVENPYGGVEIRGTDTNTAQLTVEKRYGDASQRVREWIKNAKVHLEGTSNSLRVRIEMGDCFNCFNWGMVLSRPNIHVRLQVPRQVNVETDVDRGDTLIMGIRGNVTIESDRSPVRIEGLDGALKIHADRGKIHVRDLALSGPLDIQADRSDVDVAVTSLKGPVDVMADRGDITLQLPRGAGLDLDVTRTRRSTFKSEFSMNHSDNRSRSFRSSVNGGGNHVRLRQDRGSIRLLQGSAAL